SDRGQPLLHLIGQDQIRVVTLKAQQGRSHGPVPTASRSQRAIQINPQRRDRAQDTGALELTSEHRSGPHRPHSMRTRRANTHSEQIENTNSHGRDPLTKLENGPADGPAGGPPPLMAAGDPSTPPEGPPKGQPRGASLFSFTKPPYATVGAVWALRANVLRGLQRPFRGSPAEHAVRTASPAATPRN